MHQELSPYLSAIEETLSDCLRSTDESVLPLYQMMRYHMGWLGADFTPQRAPQGKRLRPLLCVLACEAAGGNWRRALPAATSVELVHNFSLIHDDIEDRSDARRHRPTLWSLWGEAQGINTGDAMWTVARLALLQLADGGYPADVVLAAVRLVETACLNLCAGQYLDIHFETVESVSLDEYMRMISGKTAALMAASVATGALLAGADATLLERMRLCGHELGLTFQMVDDLLGIWGDPATTGKSAATDLLTKKKTLPVLYALEWEREHGLSDLALYYKQPTITPDDLPGMLQLLNRAGAQQEVQRRTEQHLSATLAHLRATQLDHRACRTLEDLAVALLERTS